MKIIKMILAAALMMMHLPLIAMSQWLEDQVQTALQECFDEHERVDIQIKPLLGGYSATSMLVEVKDKSYVLRVIQESEPALRVQSELCAMQKAAAAGVAPIIHWIGRDGHAILMDYISGGTLSIETSKNHNVIAKIAESMRKVHALPKNPFLALSFEARMEIFYREHTDEPNNQSIFEEAIAIIREGTSMLQSLGTYMTNTHGDLSSRNILAADKIYFIDWSEGMYTDPFHDLSYYSILMDYDCEEEALLLQNYLQRDPTEYEKKRFLITKKMNFARLALGTQNIGNILNIKKEDEFCASGPFKEWAYYANMFANNDDVLSPQFFWEFARVSLESAYSIKLDN